MSQEAQGESVARLRCGSSAHGLQASTDFPCGLHFLGINARGCPEAQSPFDDTVLVFVPAGSFMMGSEECPGERPLHAIHLAGFWIAKTAVTHAQYERFVRATGHKSAGNWEAWARSSGDRCPVVDISWYDAVAYCHWARLRLPSEAEWERAARGVDGLRYPWGDTWDAARCHGSDSWGGAQQPAPVGSYPGDLSPVGCLDMAGNVAEWCSSRYQPYPYEALDGREAPEPQDGELRVLRGGSWDSGSHPSFYRSADRGWLAPSLSRSHVGFRPAKSE